MSEATFTFRVDEALKTEFSQVAKSNDRTGAQLLRDFMREYVREQKTASDYDSWFRQAVKAGIDAANAGDVVSAKDVEAEAAAWREAVRQKRARPL